MKIHQQLSGHRDMNKIVLIDKNDIEKDKAEQKAFSKSPKIMNLVEVKITNVTSIFIQHGKSKEAAKRKFLITHKNSIF